MENVELSFSNNFEKIRNKGNVSIAKDVDNVVEI